MLQNISIGFSLSIFYLGTYFVWFSKKNIFNHLNLGLCFVAYIVPAFVVDLTDFSSKEVINLYVLINIIGSLAFLAGIIFGYKWKRLIIFNTAMQFNFINDLIINKEKVARMLKLISIIYIGSLIGLVISFMLMGFVPLFAAEPYMAKFFKGEYQAPYNRVAFLYRTSRQLLEFLIPLKVLELFNKISLKNIILVTLGIILIAISLNRSPILSGALVAISIVVALKKSNSPFRAYLIAVFFAYVIGSSIYFILGSLYPDSLFGLAANNVNFFESIAYGAPDITDQLQFLNAFLDAGQHYTYGLTFIGGLIPFNFPWNPSVYTLLVLNNTNDISDIASGGLRLPPSLWGYVSFGWIGVIILPLLSGFLLGYLVKKVKAIINKLSEDMTGYFVFFFIQFAFTNIGGIFVNFFTLSIYALPGIFLFYVLVKSGRKKIKSLETVN